MDQRKIDTLTAELAVRLEGRQKFGGLITNDYIERIVNEVVAEYRSLPDFELTDQESEGIKFKLGTMFNIMVGEGSITLNNPDIPRWFKAKKSEIEWSYWAAYRQMLVSQARSLDVLKENEKVIDDVLDFSGDPTVPGCWARKGLVMGNVQSGKTQNYLGLINKAIDAGYKVVILLGGHLNDLRRQTQERVDSGVVGRVSRHLINTRAGGAETIGVSKFRSSSKNVHTLTTTEGDFSSSFANSLGVNLTGLSEPAIFTVKKQTKVLENLYEWIKNHHLLEPEKGKKLDLPLLLIDDEADYASVNTKAHQDEVTKTNEFIRKLLTLFNRSTYVGYTATPFANIFIDPDTDDAAVNDDLFPRDFMVKIPVPENYVGQEHFFGAVPTGTVVIDDATGLMNLKSQDYISSIPESLMEAIRVFILNICVRTIRGNPHAHNTMMVNVSHLKSHQDRIASLISDYHAILSDAIESFSGLGVEEARKNSIMEAIEKTFLTKFGGKESYAEIFKELAKATTKVEVFAANQGGKELDYSKMEEWGLCAIVVGGHKLSRGLTLEGLTVSYFTRNSKAYDTLMQMCRWFGYRPGYTDLCKVYLPFESLRWYSFITLAIRDLYNELELMSKAEKRPSEFGLKVREHPGAMIITAKNKMSTAESIVRSQDLWGHTMRRFQFSNNIDTNKSNIETTENFIENCRRESDKEVVEQKSGSTIFENVSYHSVIEFIRKMVMPEDDVGNDALIKHLLDMEKNNLPKPHVCVINQSTSRASKWDGKLIDSEAAFIKKKISLGGIENITLFSRAMRDDGVNFKTSSVQLGNPDDEKLFLSDQSRIAVENGIKNAVSFHYLGSNDRNFPGIIIYPFAVCIKNQHEINSEGDQTARLGHGLNPTIGFTVSIPRPDNLKHLDKKALKKLMLETRHSYQINKVYQEQLAQIEMFESDIDE
jgi:hypothetical protein